MQLCVSYSTTRPLGATRTPQNTIPTRQYANAVLAIVVALRPCLTVRGCVAQGTGDSDRDIKLFTINGVADDDESNQVLDVCKPGKQVPVDC